MMRKRFYSEEVVNALLLRDQKNYKKIKMLCMKDEVLKIHLLSKISEWKISLFQLKKNSITLGNHGDNDDDLDVEEWWDNLQEKCRLMQLNTLESQIRIGAEIAITVGAFLYLAAAVREARFLGTRMFFENLVNKWVFVIE